MGKRILACGEFTQLSTGYAVYMRGLLTRLQNLGYEVAELACACTEDDQRLANVNWRVFPNIPSPKNKVATDKYKSYPGADYGAWQFEGIVNDFRPDTVIDIRDPWHLEFILRSPLRDFYSTVIMPAIDAEPQNKQWLNVYSKCDAVLSYTNWGIDVLKQSGMNIKTFGATPPMASPEYRVMDKATAKRSLGLENKLIVGMVGRNQKRKLFPELFKAFSDFLQKSQRADVYLYIHTKYPDRGWNIDEELLKYGIANKTYLTYVCQNCGSIEASLYKGYAGPCYNCGYANSCVTANSDTGIPNDALATIYNSFDLYVQWATNEGYGIPAMEAAACGVPIVGVDYSAISEVVKNTGGHLIKPVGFHQEIETGRKFAVPDNAALTDYMVDFFSLPSQMRARKGLITAMNYSKNWSEEICYGNWVRAIDNTKAKKPWNSPPQLHKIPDAAPKNLSNKAYAEWLIKAVLNKHEYLGSELEARLVRDLNDGVSPGGFGGLYYHELNSVRITDNVNYITFNQDVAFNIIKQMAEINLFWEKARAGIK